MATAEKTLSPRPRLKVAFDSQIRSKLKEELGLDNIHQVPQIEKVILNVGLGRSKEDKRAFELAENTITKITGQKPVITVAKKSISNFKLREGQNVGMKVTLRGDKMYEFLDRVINIVLPRVRDFHGVSSKAFDMTGNFSLGFSEQSVFPELGFEDVVQLHGLQIVIVTTTYNVEHSRALLSELGMPFEKEIK